MEDRLRDLETLSLELHQGHEDKEELVDDNEEHRAAMDGHENHDQEPQERAMVPSMEPLDLHDPPTPTPSSSDMTGAPWESNTWDR